jgi:hypothetical protein
MQPGDLVLGGRFIVVAANPPVAAKSISERGQPGFYLIQTEPSPGSFVRFSGSSESAVLDRGASWVHDQSRRKDGGVLTASAPVIVTHGDAPPPAKRRKKKGEVAA